MTRHTDDRLRLLTLPRFVLIRAASINIMQQKLMLYLDVFRVHLKLRDSNLGFLRAQKREVTHDSKMQKRDIHSQAEYSSGIKYILKSRLRCLRAVYCEA
jgi:hypothetical protein